MQNPYVVIDLETTGFSLKEDSIVEIGAVRIENGQISDTFSTLVKQDRPLTDICKELTGITDDDLADAPTLEEVIPQFLKFVDGYNLIAHNASFDVSFLNAAFERCGYLPVSGRCIDTLELAQILWPQETGYALEMLTFKYGIPHEKSHRALSDAKATAELFLLLQRQAKQLPLLVLQQIEQLNMFADWNLRDFFAELLQDPVKLAQTEIPEGCTVIQQLVHRPVEIAERSADRREPLEFDAETATSILSNQGPLADQYADYEERTSQMEMARTVADALLSNQHLVVEAGTGTGKSLAYLVPAIYYAVASGERVAVATHTINLQEQIKDRDLPLLQQILPISFRATVVKGRNNYVCMRKVANGIHSQGMVGDASERSFYARMLTWLLETAAGDKEELNLQGSHIELWNRVASDSDSCIAKKCPWFRNCYYFRNRSATEQSDLLITNHSLVFTDLNADHRVLPAYSSLIVDEAHHLEDEATKHLGEEAGYYQSIAALNRLVRENKQGLIVQMRTLIGLHPEFALLARILDEMTDTIATVRQHAEETFRLLQTFAIEQANNREGGRWTVRIHHMHTELPIWQAILSAFDNLQTDTMTLRQLMKRLEQEAREHDDEIIGFSTDISGQIQEFDRQTMTMTRFFREAAGVSNESDRSVLWLEADEKSVRPAVSLHVTPVHVGQLLNEKLFEKKDSVVLTSATITVNQGFSYLIDRLGLRQSEQQGRLLTLQVESPFDYKKQALLCIPTDVVPVKGVSDETFVDSFCQSITSLARISKGRMLVLFTSHKMLRDAYMKVKPALAEHGIRLFAQGIDSSSRMRLVHQFKQEEKAVLFGANSFWEGVDIPGEDLSCLVIVRLPFWPPNHPIAEARTEAIEKEGRNAFMEYSVPQAIVRFKQGFGRLIRSKKDTGAIVVYDRRLVEARYGRHFIKSLPNPWIYQGPEQDILKVIYNWLKN
ncbi:ATP-dependent DNA helicase DinG [Effusibacillus dendaii]|uniref:3'-5' exonuclease DinG n=1 Tax=Effusibacillus dendaii TaxID=2743772 RepID=A0A7I8D5K1_9BACL|nr:ATP-dependent DNA helicase DinG [Effusibacillus dendaii]BCJ85428.1 ATP-dependent helicase DinG [Effusibacillus dendaii]